MANVRMILAGIEATYGTDPTLDPGANAILTSGLQITPLESDEIDRNLDTDEVGNTEAILTGRRVSVQFSVEACGSGTAGEVPAYGVLLRAAGFAETAEVGVNASYDLVDDLDTVESAFMYVYWRGALHKLKGARGTVSLNVPARDIARFSFEFTGLLVPVEAGAPGEADYSAFLSPSEVNTANTDVTIDGFQPVLESLQLSLAHPVNYISRVGREAVELGNPQPTGQMVIEAPDLADKNFFTAAGGAAAAMSLQHGTEPGNIVTVNIDKVQTMAPTYSDLDETGDGLQIPLRPIGSGIQIVVS